MKTSPKNSARVRLDGNIARRAVRASEFFWWDAELPGFGLRTFPGGAKSWFVQFRQRGKQKRVTLGRLGEMSAIDARTAARALLMNVALDGLPAAPKASRKTNATIRLGDYAPRFWEDYSRHWKPSSQKGNHLSIFKELVKEFGHQRVDAIRRADILRWRDSCVERGGAPARASAALKFSAQCSTMPNAGATARKAAIPAHSSAPTSGASASASCQNRKSSVWARLDRGRKTQPLHAIIIYLLLLAGCRRSEITDPTWSEVKGGRLLLHDSKTGPRTVWLGDEARMLLSILERRGPSDPVFWNKLTRRPVRDIEAFWRDVKAEAGLPGVRLHDLRHSFASHAAARSETLPMIGKLLGHARLQSTSRYAHLDDGHVLDAAERIGQLIADALGDSRSLNHNTKCDRGSLIHDR